MTLVPRTSGPVIAVVGAGFGGLSFCRMYRGPGLVVLFDRQNHHLFQPLLYQVAMAGLSGPHIATPIRSILSGYRNVQTHLAEVESIDLANRRLTASGKVVEWDYLVLAPGGVTSYFGHDEWAQHAPGLKTLADAVSMRRRILTSFELAENESDPDEIRRLMTIIVVGGGPTGVELAGAMAELAHRVFRRDFRRIDPTQARVILVEAADRILPAFPPDLSVKARKQLEDLGVQVMTNSYVTQVEVGRVKLSSGGQEVTLEAANCLWGAGVAPSPLLSTLEGVQRDPKGRVVVLPDLSIPGHQNAFVIGDSAAVMGQDIPALAPAAMQMGAHVARLIRDEGKRGPLPPQEREPFSYWDRGMMATIGRRRAVAISGPLRLSGFIAWVMWLVVHLIFLINFRNRIVVLLEWTWQYLTYSRGARIIPQVRWERRKTSDSQA
ncbi:MAG TPA: NAD(P)/FAD-dependent oxidoreductase [Chloroflexi bacterium]|nr:NAD(P)/FAD-dependent oxidoreductase [Chloroflexota bacterium]